ncbi:hypothetical protein BHM03_00028362, partial [Ensete ventricosum]
RHNSRVEGFKVNWGARSKVCDTDRYHPYQAVRTKRKKKREKKRDNLEIQRRSPSTKSIVRGEKKPWEGFAKRISFSDREEKKTTFLLPRVGFSLRLRGNVSSPRAGRRNVSP